MLNSGTQLDTRTLRPQITQSVDEISVAFDMIAQLRFPSWKDLQQTIPAFTVLTINLHVHIICTRENRS